VHATRAIAWIRPAVPLLLFAVAASAGAGGPKLLATDPNHVAIQGYDTVAYFTDPQSDQGQQRIWVSFGTMPSGNLRVPLIETCSPPIRTTICHSLELLRWRNGGRASSAADPEAWAIVDGKPLHDRR